MRTSTDFGLAVRGGRRAGSATLVGHWRESEERPLLVGFVVSRAVGNAVARNRTRRRLRHLVADRLPAVPSGGRLVLRANPAAAEADSARLAGDLDRVLTRLGVLAESGAR